MFTWGKGVQPNISVDALWQDTRNFLAFLYDELKFPGTLLWWKPEALDMRVTASFSTKASTRSNPILMAKIYQTAAQNMTAQFAGRSKMQQEPLILLADLYQTSLGIPTYAGGHYHTLVHHHNNILLNTLCPGAKQTTRIT